MDKDKNKSKAKETHSSNSNLILRSNLKGGKNVKDFEKSDKQNQTTLDNVVKKVTFADKIEKEKMASGAATKKDLTDLKSWFDKEIKKIQGDLQMLEKIKVKVKEMDLNLKKNIDNLEKRVEEFNEKLEERDKQWEAWYSAAAGLEAHAQRGDDTAVTGSESEGRPGSNIGTLSRRMSAWSLLSGVSNSSACLSEREVGKMRRLLKDKERDERAMNVVIKGVARGCVENVNVKEWLHEFLKIKIGVDVDVVATKIESSGMIIAKLSSADDKYKIMFNKSKLKGSNIFIGNDLSYEERKTQEEINKWARDMRMKGRVVKIGTGRVRVGDKWIRWEDKGRLKDFESEGQGKKRVDGGDENNVDERSGSLSHDKTNQRNEENFA